MYLLKGEKKCESEVNYWQYSVKYTTSPYESNCFPNDFFPVPPNPYPCLSVPMFKKIYKIYNIIKILNKF